MDSVHSPIASRRHTVILCAILLAIAGAGALAFHSSRPGSPAPAGPGLYLGLMVAELGLLYYVWVGLKRAGSNFAVLVSVAPLSARRIIVDALAGVALFAVLYGVSDLLTGALGHGDARLVQPLIAAARGHPILWILLSLIAAVSEELTYRGYLQRQFLAWSRTPLIGIPAQAILFGVTHGYQGPVLITKITLLGLIFGAAAYYRGSRLPGILAHAALNIVGGLGLLV